jgi:putative membrane protein
MKIGRFLKQFNWRFLLVRILVNALALAITAAVMPKIYFVDKSVWSWLLMAVTLGILNALLKPLLQFLTLQFIFVTYGLVIVLVNSLILWLLSLLFPERFAVDNLLWALAGGLVLGLLSSFLESLLGLTMPIVPEEAATLRRRLEEEARHVGWLAAASHEPAPEEQALALEPPVPDAKAPAPAVPGPAGAEPSTTEPDQGPSPPAEDEAEPFDSVVMPPSEAAAPAGAGGSVDPETAPGPREEQKEDHS